MPLGIIDDAEEHTFCVKKKIPPCQEYLSWNILGDMDGIYLK